MMTEAAAMWTSYSTLPEDLWLRNDHERNWQTSNNTQHNYTFQTNKYFENQSSNNMPTPPNSPPLEQELDHLLETIPEILESPSHSTPQEFKDILNDLEATSLGPYYYSPPLPQYGGWCSFNAPLTSYPEKRDPLKKDIMWGGGVYGADAVETQKLKQRSVSESSDENRSCELRGSSFYLEDENEHLPDTPCVSDTDVDEEPLECETSSKVVVPPSYPKEISYSTLSVNREHNYCEQKPSYNASIDHPFSSSSSSSDDTDEEIDVVSWCDSPNTSIHNSNLTSTTSIRSSISSTLTATSSSTSTSTPPKSAQVKRQLQIAIQEAIKTRRKVVQPKVSHGKSVAAQPKSSNTCSRVTIFENFDNFESFDTEAPVLKVRTRGKPAAYTKRMREQHCEVLKTNKRRRVSKENEDEEEKRSNHNFMERKRRVNLKAHFEHLRDKIPDIHKNEKASKVLILNKALEYISKLKPAFLREEHERSREIAPLVERNEYLKKKLQMLQESRRCS